MSLENILFLALACFVAMATPGPGVFAVVSRSLAFGFRSNLGFIGGMMLGDLVLLVPAISGLAAVGALLGETVRLLTLLAAAYLIYLGIKCWRRPAVVAELPPKSSGMGGVLGGLALTVSNPKVILFYLAVLPAFIDLGSLTLRDGALIALTIQTVLFIVMTTYAVMSAAARSLFRSTRGLTVLNRTAACVMIGTGCLIAVR